MIKTVIKLWQALICSWKGLKYAIKNEHAFRLELALSVILIPLAFYLADTILKLLLLWFSWFLVLIIEIINTSLEATVNRIGLEHHELSGEQKI